MLEKVNKYNFTVFFLFCCTLERFNKNLSPIFNIAMPPTLHIIDDYINRLEKRDENAKLQ